MGMIEIMNKKIYIVWFLIIFNIILLIFVLGLKEKDLSYIKLELNLKIAAREYIKENNIKPNINDSQIIFINDLKDNKRLNKLDIKKYNIDNIVYYNGLLFDKYTINKKSKE